MDPYQNELEFDGGVFGKAVPGEKRKATVIVDVSGLRARTDEGQEFALGWRGLKLEAGGASGDVVFCHNRAGKHTIYSESADFLRALETLGGNEIADQIARLAGQRVSSRPKHLFGCLLTLAIVIGLFYGIPALFRSSLDLTVDALPYSVDEAVGEAASESMDAGGPEVDDEVVRGAVQTMLDRLTPHVTLEDATFQFRVIENEQANAFALPGGYITVFTGLIEQAERPEMVAGVLAHEIAHVTKRHGLRRIAHSLGVFLGVKLIIGDAEGLAGIAAELFTLATVNDYSQDQETEADVEGVRMLQAANLDPAALADFFVLLEDRYGDVPGGLAWMSSHPLHQERIDMIRALDGANGRDYEALDIDWQAVLDRLAE